MTRAKRPGTIGLVTTKLEAVYENGVFRPLTRPEGIAEHGRVTLTVIAEEPPGSLADPAGRISSDDAREMREVVEREFERVDLHADPVLADLWNNPKDAAYDKL